MRFVKFVGPIGLSVSFFLFLTPSYAAKAGNGEWWSGEQVLPKQLRGETPVFQRNKKGMA